MKVVMTAILSIIATSLWWVGVLYLSLFVIPAALMTLMVMTILCGEIYINW
jgi:hypothetical protein